jgi:hypothetical protein
MNSSTHPLPDCYFHDESGSVRFWVRSDAGRSVGAIIRKETLHYRYNAVIGSGTDALQAYQTHRGDIDVAVLRRLAKGSIEPVMLRESDLVTPPLR